MLLNDLLKVKEDVFLIEASFEGLGMNLKSLDYMDKLRSLPEGAIPKAVRMTDETGKPAGVAYLNRHEDGDFWFLIPYPDSPSMRKQTVALAGEIAGSGIVTTVKKKKIASGELASALREYLSMSLVEGVLCDCDKEKEPLSFARNEERDAGIRKLLKAQAKKHGFRLESIDALEICCGNGMSTVPLRPLFHSLMSMDYDRCAVCNGLYYDTLAPENTMVADATELSGYGLGTFGAVVGFMLGTIYEFNKPLWRKIFEESLKTVQEGGFIFLTVSKEEEIDFVAESFASMGVRGDVVDNRQNESIYDSWGFFTTPGNDR